MEEAGSEKFNKWYSTQRTQSGFLSKSSSSHHIHTLLIPTACWAALLRTIGENHIVLFINYGSACLFHLLKILNFSNFILILLYLLFIYTYWTHISFFSLMLACCFYPLLITKALHYLWMYYFVINKKFIGTKGQWQWFYQSTSF